MTGSRAPRYQAIERRRIREAHARHPYKHHINRVPAAVRTLIPELGLGAGKRVLDYGCADQPYRTMLPSEAEYVSADLRGNARAQILLRADGTVPVESKSFDAVLSTQVLEHVEDPARYLSECHRVLRPGGRLLLSTHGIFPYHPDPADYWRWTCQGLRDEVESAGFAILRFDGVIGMAATGLQLFQDAVSYRIGHRWTPWLALVMQAIIAFVDRFETAESLGYNAQVFALVAARVD